MVPPLPQLHMPPLQLSPAGHILPQLPQLLGSVPMTFTQVAVQSVGVLGGHEQAPLKQTISGAAPVQDVPSITGVVVVGHPVPGTHAPATWHWGAGQVTGEPVQSPLWQVSPWRHTLPASHAVPLGTCGGVHIIVVELHVPWEWH